MRRDKIGRNDPCWCGSGLKFKKCHLPREGEAGLPVEAIAHSTRKFFKAKRCLHPLASPESCGRIISAHTIQRHGPLAAIVDKTGHCLGFYPRNRPDIDRPNRRGWKEVSTFAGFCEHHDSEVFKPLETVQFAGTDEQCFLLAYRAESHEYYQKLSAISALEPMRRDLERGQSQETQRMIAHFHRVRGAGLAKGLRASQLTKSRMDHELLSSQFSGWNHSFFVFKGALSIASTGTITPNISINGHPLQELHVDTDVIERVYMSLVRSAGNGAVILSWREESSQMTRFVSEIEALDRKTIPGILAQLAFVYIENSYFSAEWWDSLPEASKAHIRKLALISNAYYEAWELLPDLSVPWTVTAISRHWTGWPE